MEIVSWFLAVTGSSVVGCALGMWLRDFKWREKGDHDYMNTMESGGRLYKVKLIP